MAGPTTGAATAGITVGTSTTPKKTTTATLPTADNSSDTFEQTKRLREMLAVLGLELPASITDVKAAALRMTELQDQIGLAIQGLAGSPGGIAGVAGRTLFGPPDPETASKLAALADLQDQLGVAANSFADYAYAALSPAAPTLSASTVARAYGEGRLTRDQANERLLASGLSQDDVNILLDLEKQDVKPITTKMVSKFNPVSGQYEMVPEGVLRAKNAAGAGGGSSNVTVQGGPQNDAVAGSTFGDLRKDLTTLTQRMSQTATTRTERLPTAAEFLADFGNSFDTQLQAVLAGGGGLGPNEAEFARSVLAPSLMSKYMAELGKIAATGQSPYMLTDGGVSSTQSVTKSTTTSGTGPSGSVPGGGGSGGGGGFVGAAGGGGAFNLGPTQVTINSDGEVVRSFVAIPKLSPLDFLKKELDAGTIKLMYEGSRRGAGSFQSSGTGITSARQI